MVLRYRLVVVAFGLLLAAPLSHAALAPSQSHSGALLAVDTFDAPRFFSRVQYDADRYTRRLAFALGLTRRQEHIVFDVLVDRTLRATQRHGRRLVYPFPRRSAERTRLGRRFWNRTDDRIARVLTGRQRRAFNRLVQDRYFFFDHDRWEHRDRFERWDRNRQRDDRYRDDRRRDRRDDRRDRRRDDRRGDRGWNP
ncbi:MAG: hypothetical protein AAFQ53_16775 [Bacteroidota bacterium]